MATEKSHKDFLTVIGNTAATTNNWRDKQYNRYYFMTFKYVVKNMLRNITRENVLDVGTSHGNWYDFLRRSGFRKIYGVELDPIRAKLAEQCGYNKIYNCDASNIPHESANIGVAVSNDVFVHIIKMEDKINVLKEVERILKPGGVFIFNHTISSAHGYPDEYFVNGYVSFISLHELISMIIKNSNFRIVDIKPTYYIKRESPPSFISKVRGRIIDLPMAYIVFFLFDFINVRMRGLQESDTVYIKLVKNG